MEEAIIIIEGEDNILSLLETFSPYLKSIREKPQFCAEIAKKFSLYAKVLVHREEQNIAGFVAFYANDFAHKIGFISMIAVKEQYQRLGIGSKLLNKVEKYLQELQFQILRLEVEARNTKALNFYRNAGFTCLEEKENSLVMQKTIMI